MKGATEKLKRDVLAKAWQMHLRPAQLVANSPDKAGRRSGLAMHDKGLPRRLVKAAQPAEQGRLVGVR